MSLIPLAIILLSIICWGIVGWLTESFRKMLRIQSKATVLVAFFLIHPNLIKMIFISLSCEIVDDDMYLEIDMSEQCWVDDHLIFVLAVSLPSLIVWGIGMPTLAIFLLRRHYITNTLLEVDSLSIFGFLYNGYRISCYYWEIIILYRKVMITFILVFLSMVSIEIQALVALAVMVAAFIVH
jgi:hypothetical protein